MYVNDLINNVINNTEANIIMYADDTVLLVKNVQAGTATENMQLVLDNVEDWCRRNKLTVNAKITKHMLVLRSRDCMDKVDSLKVKFSDTALSNVPTYKYLGVDLDRNLTYENAVHNTYLKANKKLFTLRKIRPYISQEVSVLIYKQYILPILDYADFLFDSTTKHELYSLDKVQDRAMRLIGRGHINNRAVENMYNIEPLKDRRHRHHLALMYRLSRIDRYIDADRPDITLRSRNKIKFQTPRTKLTKVMNSPFYRGARLWDMLAEEVQKATTKVRFKRLIA